MRTLFALFLLIGSAWGQAATEERIAGHPYLELETREATRARMIQLLQPSRAIWGDWHLLTPFPYAGHDMGELARPNEPEGELEKMTVGGPGPDLTRTYEGKNGHPAAWENLGDIANRMLDLHVFEDPELNDFAACYLYVPVEAEVEARLDVTCGSDDGIRLWLNGELLLDNDAARGLDPEAERLTLAFEQGTNHVLVKISEGVGGWAFQINTRSQLSGETDALLQYYLDRDFPPNEERAYYRALTLPVPDDLALEVGGLDFFANGDPVVCTRRGDVFRVREAYGVPPTQARYERFARGLHEPLGLSVRTEGDLEAVYCVQRAELTRLVDEDGDGRADLYGTYSDAWGISGNYHEFAFGPRFDRNGDAWVTLNVGFCGDLGKSLVPYRGWAVRIDAEGELTPVASGLRSPNGFGANLEGEMFYVDNQGDYVATNRLSHLRQGSWHGHPASLRWREDLSGPDERPQREPATVWFPYRKMGQSVADLVVDDTGGAFGPFAGQFFTGDQTLALVMRAFVEEVDGVWQGACFPFLSGLDCGVNRLGFAPDGSLFVGQTDRGWGSVGRKPYGLQRVVFSGETPFEIREMRAHAEGFELEFTLPPDRSSALDPDSYGLISYTYPYHAAYGAPETDTVELEVAAVRELSGDSVLLEVPNLREGYVHELVASGVRDRDGDPLLHPEAYYTLQRVPGRSRPEAPLSRVLFLTHSAGFQHEVTRREDPMELSTAEEELLEAAAGRFEVQSTQDCRLLGPESLATFDAVVFCTTGELPIDEVGREALLEWIGNGGAFIGVHCATDTLAEFEAYGDMLGASYRGHPWNQGVRVLNRDPDHPISAHLGESFEITDEIYQFGFGSQPLRVLLSLDPDSVDLSLGGRSDGNYPLAWTRDFGRGRVFYTALGHSAEVWGREDFQELLMEGIAWAIDGPDLGTPPPPGARSLPFDAATWCHGDGRDPEWSLQGGLARVEPHSGDLVTRESLGSGRYHLEFRLHDSPEDAEAQDRANSGVYVQSRYEVQVLDSLGRGTGLGDCAAIYGQKAVDVEAARAPGVWQSYDIDFEAPRFDASGVKLRNARLTVWHNGRRVHDDFELEGPTAGGGEDESPLGALRLQDHQNPVEFRNVWFLPRD